MNFDGGSVIPGAAKETLNAEPQFHKLYFNSFVCVERVVVQSEKPVTTTRFEVSIYDHKDYLVLKTNGLLRDHYVTSTEAHVRALMRGLEETTKLGINHVSIYCRLPQIFKYLSNISNPKEKKIALLMDDVRVMRKQFMSCNLVKMFDESTTNHRGFAKKETCQICFDDVDHDLMFSACVHGHRFCLACVKSHIEVKLLDRKIPTCPQHLCKSHLYMDRCGEILNEKLRLMWKPMTREYSIPYNQRIWT
ncbi:uncharacterized protein LOC111829034 [Capsella rubella]|uniref:uncharacterized protein LOC111829034 n=1 Tax=Capsella rubella TaxID=81985 RepID=UPI000CD5709E|nr:uncharacterized protein LOC111829034 [Capsella rubella]